MGVNIQEITANGVEVDEVEANGVTVYKCATLQVKLSIGSMSATAPFLCVYEIELSLSQPMPHDVVVVGDVITCTLKAKSIEAHKTQTKVYTDECSLTVTFNDKPIAVIGGVGTYTYRVVWSDIWV